MKFLKKFNESIYYNKIDKVPVEYIPFPEREKDEIYNCFHKRNIQIGSVSYSDGNNNYTNLKITYGRYPNKTPYEMQIFKIDDEWFYLTLIPCKIWLSEEKISHYKCDQLSGLLKLINDLLDKQFSPKVNESNNYYEEVYSVSIDNKSLSFRERKSIFDYIQKYTMLNKVMDINTKFYNRDGGITMVFSKYGRILYKMEFMKDDDEWFYLQLNNKIYKCDQLDGLLKLMDDLLNKEKILQK
jgi:hypothetical protein